MFTKENATEIGRKGGTTTMSRPGFASRIGRLGGLKGGAAVGAIRGKINTETGVLDAAREARAENFRKRWFEILSQMDDFFTTQEIVRIARDHGRSHGFVKRYLSQELGCVKQAHGIYRKNIL